MKVKRSSARRWNAPKRPPPDRVCPRLEAPRGTKAKPAARAPPLGDCFEVACRQNIAKQCSRGPSGGPRATVALLLQCAGNTSGGRGQRPRPGPTLRARTKCAEKGREPPARRRCRAEQGAQPRRASAASRRLLRSRLPAEHCIAMFERPVPAGWRYGWPPAMRKWKMYTAIIKRPTPTSEAPPHGAALALPLRTNHGEAHLIEPLAPTISKACNVSTCGHPHQRPKPPCRA